MAKLKGLGRGLDALLAASKVAKLPTANTQLNQILEIKLDKIRPGEFQPRVVFDEAQLQSLADSIAHNGVIQPIIVRSVKDSAGAAHYEIIAGERRFRASALAGVKQIPAIVRNFNDEEALAVSLIENIQRKDLNVIEEAMGYKRLIDEFKLTHAELSKVTGNSRSHVTNILRLLRLHAQVQQMLIHSQLTMGHARALLSLSPESQLTLATLAVNKALTTAEVERRVANITLKQKPASSSSATNVNKSRSLDLDINKLERKIAAKLGLGVSIKYKQNGCGKIVLSYSTRDELNNLLKLLNKEGL